MLISCILKVSAAISSHDLINEFKYDDADIINFFKAYKGYLHTDTFTILDTHIKLEKGDVVYDGKIIAIDVGSSNLKIGYFDGIMFEKLIFEKMIPRDGSVKDIDMFLWIAKSIESWLDQNCMNKTDNYAIAMTFSYPVKLRSLSSGHILTFTKKFPFKLMDFEKTYCPGRLLDAELNKLSLNMSVKVILNDATAAFVALMQRNLSCNVGIVLGSGTNGAFVFNNKLVNSEWGHFNSPKIRKNMFDRMIKFGLKNEYYACIDCMIGGMKFMEMLEILFKSKPTNIMDLYYKMDSRMALFRIIQSIKKRIYLILAIMTVASVEGNDYNISILGSGLTKFHDQRMYGDAIRFVHSLVKETKAVNIGLYYVKHASLVGAIRALRHNGKVGI